MGRLTARLDVRLARDDELERTFRLRWLWAVEVGDVPEDSESEFGRKGAEWARAHATTHLPHVAIDSDDGIIGMAWLALSPRVATTRDLDRWSGDLQSCYVLPEHRGAGIGGALVRAVFDTARDRGVEHVTVHASAASVGMYQRNGFRASDRLLWADVAIEEG
ncbi:MAG: GNAT family N-acetyltransferase [Humibacter sp.]